MIVSHKQQRRMARLMIALIPASCPFARTVRLGNWIAIRIPPLCKLNPFYSELMSLRLRALCYLEKNQV
jgi:hypothetical protein